MSEDGVTQQAPTVFSSKERAALVAKALSEAARRARFSTKRRRSLSTDNFGARRREKLIKLARLLSFMFLVVLPTTGAAFYFALVAADQFVSEARFTVRGGMPASMDKLGSMTGAPSMLIIQDTQVIMNFLQSRAAVETLDRSVGLQSLYRRDDVDYFSRLGQNPSIERVVKYWTKHIELSVQMPSGIVSFSVAAFRPGDAVKLVNAALDAGEDLVNQMNDQMRSDAVSLAEKERIRAQDNLAGARTNLEKARNEEGMLSAEATSQSLNGLMTEVRGQMIKLQQQFDSQRRFVRPDAPQMKNLAAKISAAKEEVSKLESQMTVGKTPKAGEGRVLSGSMSRLEYATLENTIAEKIYAGSMAALEQARLASETKLMYINIFVRPTAAEDAKYPRRALNIGLVAGIGLLCWAVALGLLNFARNRFM